MYCMYIYIYIYILFTLFDDFEEGAILKCGEPPSDESIVHR